MKLKTMGEELIMMEMQAGNGVGECMQEKVNDAVEMK
ncbi:hypothetical protein SAMN05443633_101256 [Chryseobacterium arachidis]|uniref:Uncharacterized protein n=1 Tax=Chryseobacterium arachidis TaxID=1416778 RepID=A0A1M4TK36_9FLAO|nr:hypothetical protein SAMN05443633_101256 [Chryseobacterium arachidis]